MTREYVGDLTRERQKRTAPGPGAWSVDGRPKALTSIRCWSAPAASLPAWSPHHHLPTAGLKVAACRGHSSSC